MRKLWLVAALAVAAANLGCCRMCCWQRGGSWYNGYCYPQLPQPALQPVPQQQAPAQQYYAPAAGQPCLCK